MTYDYEAIRQELYAPPPKEIYIHGTSAQRLMCIPFQQVEETPFPFLTEEERECRRVRQGWVRV
jgi:hypothetical protein